MADHLRISPVGPTSSDLPQRVAQPGAKRLEFPREAIDWYVGSLQFVGGLIAGREEKDQCRDESAVGSDVDSFRRRSLGRREAGVRARTPASPVLRLVAISVAMGGAALRKTPADHVANRYSRHERPGARRVEVVRLLRGHEDRSNYSQHRPELGR